MNPQVLLGFGTDREAWTTRFRQPEWREAAEGLTLVWLPRDLMTRPGPGSGLAVLWLASLLHPGLFQDSAFQLAGDRLLGTRPVPVTLPVVTGSAVVLSRIADVRHKTLTLSFREPQTVLSTLEGLRSGILTVANHHIPPPCWGLLMDPGADRFRSRVLAALDLDGNATAMLITGADMDNLAVSEKRFKDLAVTAAVTAGVRSNAQRMSRSPGWFYEPGTVNIILAANMALTPGAMARAVITATEAKTAALQDLDIRSSDDPLALEATGTGTDNILVVQGTGPLLDSAGGHSRLGELIASAVHEGVTRAVLLQNGIAPGRSIFRRLEERGLTLRSLARFPDPQADPGAGEGLAAGLEAALTRPDAAGLVASALSLSDAASRNLAVDLTWLDRAGADLAGTMAGRPLDAAISFPATRSLPRPLATVLDWILTGVASARDRKPGA
jgi:adenosylcobinamide amidohydrolase